MSDVTHILSAIEQGDPRAAQQLLPLVYEELRRLAAQKMAHEKPGQTLDPTALVHEAYLRLVSINDKTDAEKRRWHGRGHFFAAAAEAMRVILIDNARRKKRPKHGGDRRRVAMIDVPAASRAPDELLALDDAIGELAAQEPDAARIVKLRFYGGHSVEEAAEVLEIPRATAYRHWTYARAWLRCRWNEKKPSDG